MTGAAINAPRLLPVPISAGSNNGLMGHPKKSGWTKATQSAGCYQGMCRTQFVSRYRRRAYPFTAPVCPQAPLGPYFGSGSV
jgi:hypothetical protein